MSRGGPRTTIESVMVVPKSTRSSRQDRLLVSFTISGEIEFQSVEGLPLLGAEEKSRLPRDPILRPQSVSAGSTCVLVLEAASALLPPAAGTNRHRRSASQPVNPCTFALSTGSPARSGEH